MSVIQELAEIVKRTSVLLGFDTPTSFLTLIRKMLEVTDPPSKVIDDVRAELNARDIGVNGTLRYLLENPPPPMFPCACDGEPKVTSVPCPICVRVRYTSADALRQAMQEKTAPPEDNGPRQLAEILGRQQRAVEWVNSRLGAWSMDPAERARRFLEEAVELAQAAGCSVEDARRTVDYVFARPAGDAAQEVGGARLTLLALAASLKVDAVEAEAAELARVYALPVERFRRRDDEKRAAGICAQPGDQIHAEPGSALAHQIEESAIPMFWYTHTSNALAGEAVPGARLETNGKLWRVWYDGVLIVENASRDTAEHGGLYAIREMQARAADPLLFDLTTAAATRFAPAHLTARRCSPTHLQLLDDGLVTADWWPTTGKARAAGPSGGVAAPHKIFTVDALVEWLRGL